MRYRKIAVNDVYQRPSTKTVMKWDLIPQHGQKVFAFFKVSTSDLGLTRSHNQHVQEALHWEKNSHGMKLTTYLLLIPRLIMHKAIPPLPHTDHVMVLNYDTRTT